MQLSKTLAIALLLVLNNAASIDYSSLDIDEQDQAQLSSLIADLQQFNQEHALVKRSSSDLVARSDLPIVDHVLTLLKNSGIANVVIKQVLLHPKLLDLSSNATIFLLKLNLINYADLFNAIEKSGLINQILLATLEDPNALPGILRLTEDLLKKNVIGIYLEVNPPPADILNHKRDVETDFLEMDFTNANIEPLSLSVRDNLYVRDNKLFDDLFQSLKDSGLVVSIVQSLLTDPELSDPSAQFLINILQSGAIPICDIVHILEDTGVLVKIVGDILTDPEILRAFAQLILDRIAKGIIPRDLVNSILGSNSAVSSAVSSTTATVVPDVQVTAAGVPTSSATTSTSIDTTLVTKSVSSVPTSSLI